LGFKQSLIFDILLQPLKEIHRDDRQDDGYDESNETDGSHNDGYDGSNETDDPHNDGCDESNENDTNLETETNHVGNITGKT
jgi:hypothetical protein